MQTKEIPCDAVGGCSSLMNNLESTDILREVSPKVIFLIPLSLSCLSCATKATPSSSDSCSIQRSAASVRCAEIFDPKEAVQNDRAFESSEFILKTANRNPKGTAQDLNENGAYGDKNRAYDLNKSGSWFIDNQKVGMDAIVTGVYKEDADAIERGIKILRWGFAQQKEDGSYSSGDAFHTVSYFLAAASRAVLHLKNSKFESRFSDDIAHLSTGIEKTANWLIRKDIEEPGLQIDSPYTHRFYMNGVAIGVSGLLLGRNDLILHSQNLIKQGLVKQNADGSNPEKGGSDTSYHALGLYFAAQYYSMVASGQLKADIKTMGEKGAQWLASKVLESGDVDSSQNTRTGPSGEKRYGTELKTVTYFMIYKALAYWGQILGQPKMSEAAQNVFEFSKGLKKP